MFDRNTWNHLTVLKNYRWAQAHLKILSTECLQIITHLSLSPRPDRDGATYKISIRFL